MAYLARAALLLTVLIFGASFAITPAATQSLPKYLQSGDTESRMKDNKNMWTVGLVGGLFEGTFMRFAEEIRKVLDDGDDMRVLPIVSRGTASNLEDLLYLRGVDAAVTQVDVFEYFRMVRKIPNLQDRVHYITRFPMAEMHLIVRNDVQNIEQLRGRRVHFSTEGGAGAVTGVIVFQRLGIPVTPVYGEFAGTNEMLKRGDVDALVRVVQKPVGHVSSIPANVGFHLISVPYAKFTDLYGVGEFTDKDYPNLVAPGQVVDTIAVPAVLAVYNWPKGTDRYRRVERFVQRFFANFDRLQKPPYHPKWKEVNLSATIPGWTRFAVAEAELQKLAASASLTSQPADIQQDFRTFISSLKRDGPRSREEIEGLFQEFLVWRQRQGAR